MFSPELQAAINRVHKETLPEVDERFVRLSGLTPAELERRTAEFRSLFKFKKDATE